MKGKLLKSYLHSILNHLNLLIDEKEKLFEMQTFIALPIDNSQIDKEAGIKIPDR
jgi:hypothetical protein